MLHHISALRQALLHSGVGVLVRVAQAQGSVPRDAGAWMFVTTHAVVNTIGGGHLEFQAIAHAREHLQSMAMQGLQAERGLNTNDQVHTQRYALGPSLGQCCGGVAHLSFQTINHHQLDGFIETLQLDALRLPTLALFGGGHVGHAIVRIFATLPYRVLWVDSRDEIFPNDLPAHVACEHSAPVQAAVADLPAGSQLLIMSFSHAEDLEIVASALARQREKADLKCIGLIGSKTKWASFQNRLRARGFADVELAEITCPIGLPTIKGKAPEVIAVSVAAQLLANNT